MNDELREAFEAWFSDAVLPVNKSDDGYYTKEALLWCWQAAIDHLKQQGLLVEFPPHKCGLFLEHNSHLNVYATVEEYYPDGWLSDEQREKAIASNNVWSLQWYPDTPVGFYRLVASDLEILLQEAIKANQ